MRPFVANNHVWRVVRVAPDDPQLDDYSGKHRIATADPVLHMIYISESVTPPLLDRVILHEVSHAMTNSYGFVDELCEIMPGEHAMLADELIAQSIERYSIEATIAASEILGRPLCIRGYCMAG